MKGGQVIGATDPVRYTPIERPIHPCSLHVTMLHALGIDQNELLFQHNGRDEIPTFVETEILYEVFERDDLGIDQLLTWEGRIPAGASQEGRWIWTVSSRR